MSSESILQQTTVAMLRTLYPALVLNLSLNGISLNGLSATQRAQLIRQAKLEGMEPGIQDLTIYLPDSKVLNLEFKRPKGGVQSADQQTIESKLRILGHNYYLVRTPEEIFELIAQYTTIAFRQEQFNSLLIISNNGFLTKPFLHWTAGTTISTILAKLKELYQLS